MAKKSFQDKNPLTTPVKLPSLQKRLQKYLDSMNDMSFVQIDSETVANKDANALCTSHQYLSKKTVIVKTDTNLLNVRNYKNCFGEITMGCLLSPRIFIRRFSTNRKDYLDVMRAYSNFAQVVADNRPTCPGCGGLMNMGIMVDRSQQDSPDMPGKLRWACTSNEWHYVKKKSVEIGKMELQLLPVADQKIIKREEQARTRYFVKKASGGREPVKIAQYELAEHGRNRIAIIEL